MTQTNRFVVAETFGVKAPRGLTVEGFTDPTHPQIPVNRPYVFGSSCATCWPSSPIRRETACC